MLSKSVVTSYREGGGAKGATVLPAELDTFYNIFSTINIYY